MQALAEVAGLLEKNKVVIKIQTFPFDRAAEAYRVSRAATSAESSSWFPDDGFQGNPDVVRLRRSCVWLRRVRGFGFLRGVCAAGSQRRSWRILSLVTWKTAPIWSRVQPSSLSW